MNTLACPLTIQSGVKRRSRETHLSRLSAASEAAAVAAAATVADSVDTAKADAASVQPPVTANLATTSADARSTTDRVSWEASSNQAQHSTTDRVRVCQCVLEVHM